MGGATHQAGRSLIRSGAASSVACSGRNNCRCCDFPRFVYRGNGKRLLAALRFSRRKIARAY
jgi:hypothetical protein